ncbi:hypothetical protein BDM02DRAFT_3129922 [Thelephora ganbajun]|uniref:Uncharacterized protein n=1 Tax=Thelephora ganbajun TaxID=370292 RepID=A0ACB6ZCU1_THEGA|nr:hypothetical protein BDM02DRAFT_3129922 [Thelephora ganbajun]
MSAASDTNTIPLMTRFDGGKWVYCQGSKVFKKRDDNQLSEMEKEFTFPPRGESSESDPVIPEMSDVLRSAWVGPFVNVPLSSIKGRKHRQRERLQRAKEAKASKHPVTPPVDVVTENIAVDPCENKIRNIGIKDDNDIPWTKGRFF